MAAVAADLRFLLDVFRAVGPRAQAAFVGDKRVYANADERTHERHRAGRTPITWVFPWRTRNKSVYAKREDHEADCGAGQPSAEIVRAHSDPERYDDEEQNVGDSC